MNPLPRLLLLADRFTQPDRAARTAAAVQAGVRWVQLRDHAAPPTVFAAQAAALIQALQAITPPPLITINTRHEVAQAHRLGLHMGTRGPSVADARTAIGAGALLGVSVHEIEEALQAHSHGADYVIASPIFPTSSKPGHPGRGVAWLKEVVEAVAPLPVLALGGIRASDVGACLDAGAYGVAVLSGILQAADAASAARPYLAALSEYVVGPSGLSDHRSHPS